MAQTENEHVAKIFLNSLIPEGTTASTKENSKNTHVRIAGNAEMNLQTGKPAIVNCVPSDSAPMHSYGQKSCALLSVFYNSEL